MTIVVEHLKTSSPEKRRAFVVLMSRLIFPMQGYSGDQIKWTTKATITRVTVWGERHFLNNLRLAMIREALGLGPNHYCIIRSGAPNFSNKVFLMMKYLPPEKLSIRPLGPPLQGPFLNPRRVAIGQEISQRVIPLGEIPPFCRNCYAWWCRSGVCRGLLQDERDDDD